MNKTDHQAYLNARALDADGRCQCGCGGQTTLAVKSSKRNGWIKGKPIHFICGHQKTVPIEKRFWDRVDKDGPLWSGTPCWLWQPPFGNNGYGEIKINGTLVLVHRQSYEWAKGLIPDGLTIDHLCRVRPCVNPDHLEVVTIGVNVLRGESPSAVNARKTVCSQGHPFTEKNRHGRRVCNECKG